MKLRVARKVARGWRERGPARHRLATILRSMNRLVTAEGAKYRRVTRLLRHMAVTPSPAPGRPVSRGGPL
jgi:hypothetical protein